MPSSLRAYGVRMSGSSAVSAAPRRGAVVAESLTLAVLGGAGLAALAGNGGGGTSLPVALIVGPGGLLCLVTAVPWLVLGLIVPPTARRHRGLRIVQLLIASGIALALAVAVVLLGPPGAAGAIVFAFIAMPAPWLVGCAIVWLVSAMLRDPDAEPDAEPDADAGTEGAGAGAGDQAAGAATGGAAQDGAVTDGAVSDGAVSDGPVQDGAVQDGAVQDDEAQEGAAGDEPESPSEHRPTSFGA